MKIAIRADGGNKIGIGHIMRTLVLAKELAKTNEVFYVCRIDNPLSDKYKKGIEKIKSEDFKVKLIDENNVLNALNIISADMLITDSYDVDENYFNQTKKMFKYTTYIDDMNKYYFNVDFLINQNINADEYAYKTNKDTKLFLGPQYIMLRKEFINSTKNIINQNVKNILITVGGSDFNKITEILLDILKDLNLNFSVVVGPSFTNIESLKQFEFKNKNIKLYYNADMCTLMKKCDIAISACGSTLYELAAVGVPTLGLVIADNQEKIADCMHKKGIIYNLGWYDKINKEDFINKLMSLCKNYELRKQMVKNQKVINKNGVIKLVDDINANINFLYLLH